MGKYSSGPAEYPAKFMAGNARRWAQEWENVLVPMTDGKQCCWVVHISRSPAPHRYKELGPESMIST
jgi:hypothetical protein